MPQKSKNMTWVLPRTLKTLMLVGFFITSPAAFAQEEQISSAELEQLVKNGQKLAAEKCASCHSIEKTGDSTNKDAPPFRSFASKWPLETLEESLAEGIVTGHEEMPEIVFKPAQITAFLEFLRTLQKN